MKQLPGMPQPTEGSGPGESKIAQQLGGRGFDEAKHPRDDAGKFTDSGGRPSPNQRTFLTKKEMAEHLRQRLKHEGIKARVNMSTNYPSVMIDVPKYEMEFTQEEQRKIRTIAKLNGLTWARGLPINPEQMTNPKQFLFWMPNK